MRVLAFSWSTIRAALGSRQEGNMAAIRERARTLSL